MKEPLLHDTLGAVEKEGELGRAHGALKGMGLVELARESCMHMSEDELALRLERRRNRTINQEQLLLILAALHATPHGVLEKLYRHLHGHNGTLLDVCLDHLAKLATCPVLLLAQQVTSRQVLEAVVANELLALRALSGTGTAENKEHRYLILGPERSGALGDGDLLNGWHRFG